MVRPCIQKTAASAPKLVCKSPAWHPPAATPFPAHRVRADDGNNRKMNSKNGWLIAAKKHIRSALAQGSSPT